MSFIAAMMTVMAASSGCSSSQKTSDESALNAGSTQRTGNVQTALGDVVSPVKAASKDKIDSGIGTPVSLTALSINLISPIDPIGKASDDSISPKQNQLGWDSDTPAPGKAGHTVIAGHVTYNGIPDVFARLGDLKKGDVISILTSKNKTLNYVVTYGPVSIDKDKVRHDARVWGPTTDDMLVLVSCDTHSGYESKIHHKNNIIVWAKRK